MTRHDKTALLATIKLVEDNNASALLFAARSLASKKTLDALQASELAILRALEAARKETV